MPKAFAEHCSINKWNEEIWENSHILNKRLIHVAVFPGGTAKYTPEQQARLSSRLPRGLRAPHAAASRCAWLHRASRLPQSGSGLWARV